MNQFTFGDEPMSYAEFINIQCIVSGGDMPVNITWLLNDKPFDEYLEIYTTKRGKRILELTIESVAAKHMGNYSCVAENKAGRVNYTAELKVNGVFFSFFRTLKKLYRFVCFSFLYLCLNPQPKHPFSTS